VPTIRHLVGGLEPNVGFFLETYAHVLKNDDRDAAEQAASFLIGAGWDPESDDKQG
jgi:hypothetical protein